MNRREHRKQRTEAVEGRHFKSRIDTVCRADEQEAAEQMETGTVVFSSSGSCCSLSAEEAEAPAHVLADALPELARSEHLDVRHPGENPARQFLAAGSMQAEFQSAVPALVHLLARMPHPFADVGDHLFGEKQAYLPWFAGLADAERVLEKGGSQIP